MPDFIDDAQDLEEKITDYALQQIRSRPPSGLRATGICNDPLCGESVEQNKIFCGPACAQQWEKYKNVL